MNSIYDKPHYIFIFMIILVIIIIVFVYFKNKNDLLYKPQITEKPVITSNGDQNIIKSNNPEKQIIQQSQSILPSILSPMIKITEPAVDPITDYDYRTLYDPFKDPRKRTSRDLMGPIINSPLFNYPTRGLTDDYSLYGYLVCEKARTNDPNKILKLFGREKYPNSNTYQYYVMIKSGDQELKYSINPHKRELFDGDCVFVKIIKRKYLVDLFKNQDFDYL